MITPNSPNAAPKPKTVIVHIHAERKMLPNGALHYEPLHIAEADQWITPQEASKLTGMSARHISHLCDIGHFKTAHKPTGQKKGHWRIDRAEVLGYRTPPAE